MSKGYEIAAYEMFFVENPAGEEVAGPFTTASDAEKWIDEAEPWGAGSDPFGRPDPQTHPEYWME